MASLSELLETNIINPSGSEVPTRNFLGQGKIVGFYFSASWCPPCKYFSPKLMEFYAHVKSTGQGPNFEIIFVSFDNDEDGFEEHFSHMPWLGVKFELEDLRQELSERFTVGGIPCLVIMDGDTEELITRDGRTKVSQDPLAITFPWRD